MKIIGMIPARLGSTRVKNKNIRYLGNKPLVQHIIDNAKKSKLLSDIYLNSESLILKEIADFSKINFFQRETSLSSDIATNDDFALDFLNKIECDILIQLLPTSPFLSNTEIDSFIKKMIDDDLDTLISTKEIRIESLINLKPLNFKKNKHTPPSQELTPVISYACGIMGWKKNKFISNMKKFNAAYHGCDGKTGYFNLNGLSLIDIDNEEDFTIAQNVIANKNNISEKPKYYKGKNNLIYDADVKNILKSDGVINNTQDLANKEINTIDMIIQTKPKNQSWSHTVINSDSNSATLIAQLPGEGNRMHFHKDWNEWWYIVRGKWEWNIEGKKKIIEKGQIVFIEKNKKHKITAIGEGLSIRLAVSRYDVDHIYLEDDY